MDNIINKLNEIFKNVFDDNSLIINSTMSAKDIEGWDSLANIRLIVAIEKAFMIRFTANQVSSLENIGQMVDLIIEKLSGK